MPSFGIELADLMKAIERMVDADFLFPDDGKVLLDFIASIDRLLTDGDKQNARCHTRRLVRAFETLLDDGAIEPVEGRAAIAAAYRILGDGDD